MYAYMIALFLLLILGGLVGVLWGFHLAYHIADKDCGPPPKPPRRPKQKPNKELRSSPIGAISNWFHRLFSKRDSTSLKDKVHQQSGMSFSEFSCIDTDDRHSDKLSKARKRQDASYAYIAAADTGEAQGN